MVVNKKLTKEGMLVVCSMCAKLIKKQYFNNIIFSLFHWLGEIKKDKCLNTKLSQVQSKQPLLSSQPLAQAHLLFFCE